MSYDQYSVFPYGFYPPGNADMQQLQKNQEKRNLRKTSNGLGFFVLVYFLTMSVISSFLVNILKVSGAVTNDNQTTFMFLMQIIIGVASALTAGFFYRMISRKRISDYLPKSHVPLKTLVPLVFLGMGAAMAANMLAGLFDMNISLFELKNSASQTSDTSNSTDYILYVISTAVVPAFAEEFAFRGIFMSVMRKYGDSFAILSSAIMFGAMHGNTTQIVFAFILGLIFAFVDCKANSIVPSVIIHFTNNFYAVFTDIISSNPAFDSTTVTIIHIGMMILFCLLGILSYLYLAAADKNFFKVTYDEKSELSDISSLTLKEKFLTFFKAAGIIISLCLFIAEMIYNLLPPEFLEYLTRYTAG